MKSFVHHIIPYVASDHASFQTKINFVAQKTGGAKHFRTMAALFQIFFADKINMTARLSHHFFHIGILIRKAWLEKFQSIFQCKIGSKC